MTDRPILFSAPMVRALLEGRKTQTRWVLKPQPREGEEVIDLGGREFAIRCTASGDYWGMKQPPYAPGDRLWVKETWRPHYLGDGIWDLDVSYAADGARITIKDGDFGEGDWNWPKAADSGNVTPLFMPRWASRLTLLVTDVRVERLQDISEADAIAEGLEWVAPTYGIGGIAASWNSDPRQSYAALWNSINGPGAWEANPWVVAVSFEVRKGNIDA